jgi:hypothetical protein
MQDSGDVGEPIDDGLDLCLAHPCARGRPARQECVARLLRFGLGDPLCDSRRVGPRIKSRTVLG